MSALESRVTKMEQAVTCFHLNRMTDAELLAHAGTFPMFTKGMYTAVLTLVGRRPSALPVVKDDPEHAKP
ncbi:hypothetical protein ACFQNJ_07330 [Hydrogenophaga bisanensis]|uniref:Uncharacterized protein n=1 Tax=Hydrogenophaga bisanensis TaxID=439611 RepID=A0ABW2R8B1_9BURK